MVEVTGMTALGKRFARFAVLGTALVALSGLPAYAGQPSGNYEAWGGYRQAQTDCAGPHDRGGPRGWACNAAQGDHRWNGAGNSGVYPPGQVNGMSWQEAGYSPEEAWEIWDSTPKIGF